MLYPPQLTRVDWVASQTTWGNSNATQTTQVVWDNMYTNQFWWVYLVIGGICGSQLTWVDWTDRNISQMTWVDWESHQRSFEGLPYKVKSQLNIKYLHTFWGQKGVQWQKPTVMKEAAPKWKKPPVMNGGGAEAADDRKWTERSRGRPGKGNRPFPFLFPVPVPIWRPFPAGKGTGKARHGIGMAGGGVPPSTGLIMSDLS